MGSVEELAQKLQIWMGLSSALGFLLAFIFARPDVRLIDQIAATTAVMAGAGAVAAVILWLAGQL